MIPQNEMDLVNFKVYSTSYRQNLVRFAFIFYTQLMIPIPTAITINIWILMKPKLTCGILSSHGDLVDSLYPDALIVTEESSSHVTSDCQSWSNAGLKRSRWGRAFNEAVACSRESEVCSRGLAPRSCSCRLQCLIWPRFSDTFRIFRQRRTDAGSKIYSNAVELWLTKENSNW